MSLCVAITKTGNNQCRNKKKQHPLFCGIHIKSTPKEVLLDGGDLFGHTINYTNEVDYNNQLQAMQSKYNKQNDNGMFNRDNVDEELVNGIDNLNIKADVVKKDKPKSKQYPMAQVIEPEYLDDEKIQMYIELKTCNVCFDEMPTREEIIECSSSNPDKPHLVCKTCLLGHINSLQSDGIAGFECMFDKSDKCGGVYRECDIKSSFNDAGKFAKWQEMVLSSEIIKMAGICDNYIICPLCCKWGCIFEVPPGGNHLAFYIKCGNCNETWCSKCKRKSHAERSCYELHFEEHENTVIKQNRIIDKFIQDIITQTLTHCCSICGTTYIKEEGCNLMTCPKCNGLSCYICNMKLYIKNGNKYWHFTGHDRSDPGTTCPLWNNYAGDGKINQGNTDFNMKSILKQLAWFVYSNESNYKIKNQIIERIKKIFKEDKDYKDYNDISRKIDNYKLALI